VRNVAGPVQDTLAVTVPKAPHPRPVIAGHMEPTGLNRRAAYPGTLGASSTRAVIALYCPFSNRRHDSNHHSSVKVDCPLSGIKIVGSFW